MTPPAVFTIPPGQSFVDCLAGGMLKEWGATSEALTRGLILLPTRRSCRALQAAFLRRSQGQALLLPRMRPLGDLEADELAAEALEEGADWNADLPPAMADVRRRLIMARLVAHWGEARRKAGDLHAPDEAEAVHLATELARLMDQVETEGLSFEALEDLAPARYAEHWRVTLDFLDIVLQAWPAIAAEEGTVAPAERRRRLLTEQARSWCEHPPEHPVLVAGSTGTVPATAELMAVVARLPRGAVVLPGLDCDSDEAVWNVIEEDPTHPQHTLARLLPRIGCRRADVRPWPEAAVEGPHRRRARLVSRALAPAGATGEWEAWRAGLDRDDAARALEGLARIDCAEPAEEARVIALVLRETLEHPGRTAELVTPDRDLARRVAAELQRWGLGLDDSGGRPLADTPPAAFFRLGASAVAADMAPLDLLALLKHPLAAAGRRTASLRWFARRLDRTVLRGPRPAPGFDGLRRAIRGDVHEGWLGRWLDVVETAFGDLPALFRRSKAPLRDLLSAHIEAAEALAASRSDSGAARLWAGEAGEALARFLDDLMDAARGFPPLAPRRYPELLQHLMAGAVVRPPYGGHPRLAVLGPLEARLRHADVMVLGGLNEGTWPAEPDPGFWMSRPMRRDFGLPAPERRLGLSAHDFLQAACAPRVVLTRSQKSEGSPTVPSRWLMRLQALCEGLELGEALTGEAARWREWARLLDEPEIRETAPRPAPTPPLAARPRRLSVTGVETWMRDPYALYAREILRLRALDPLDADPGAAELGTVVHEALEHFMRGRAEGKLTGTLDELLAIGGRVLAGLGSRPGVGAFWGPRFQRIARWFIAKESERGAFIRHSHAEVRGGLVLDGPGGPFELVAKADRIDVMQDGSLAIIDYKTGGVPLQKDIALGFAPQLPLEAALAGAGGFPDVGKAEVGALEFWRLTGGEPAGACTPVKAPVQEVARQALGGLERLIARFDDPATPYLPVPRWDKAPRFSDYQHLARIKEWAATGGEE